MGTHIKHDRMYKRLIGVVYKTSGEFTKADRDKLRQTMCRSLTNGGFLMTTGTDELGRGMLFCFDIYVIEQLSFFERCRHRLRVFFAAVSGYIGVRSCIRVIILE